MAHIRHHSKQRGDACPFSASHDDLALQGRIGQIDETVPNVSCYESRCVVGMYVVSNRI